MAAPQQSGQSEGSLGILWVFAGLFALLGGLWYVYNVQITNYFMQLKLWEISLISYFTPALANTKYTILNSPPSEYYKWDFFMMVGNDVGWYVRIPCVILMVLLGIWIYRSNSVGNFKKLYSMKDLAREECVNWPQINPVIGLDLVKTHIDVGPWAMSLTPMAFCKKYALLEERKVAITEGMSRKDMNKIEVTLKRGKANQLFSSQLGPQWRGTRALPPHVKALFAIFAARLNGDTTAPGFLKQLNESCRTKLNFKGIDELCKKHEDTKLVKRITDCHGYILTIMASMLEGARTDGVQASADFLWLKPLDRRLWYVLNTVGRQTPFPEVAGIFAHWIAEKEMGKPLIVPMIEEATNALEKALADIVYKPDED